MSEECHTQTLELVLGFDWDGKERGSVEREGWEQGSMPGTVEGLVGGRGSREQLEAEQHSGGWISSENLQSQRTEQQP